MRRTIRRWAALFPCIAALACGGGGGPGASERSDAEPAESVQGLQIAADAYIAFRGRLPTIDALLAKRGLARKRAA